MLILNNKTATLASLKHFKTQPEMLKKNPHLKLISRELRDLI